MGWKELPLETLEGVHDFWDEMADFDVAQTDDALRYLMKSLSGWIGATNVSWAGIVRMQHGTKAWRDPQRGWRARVAVDWKPMTGNQARRLERLLQNQELEPCMACCATARQAGRFRAHRMRDGFVDFEAMSRTRHFQILREITGLEDRIWVGFPVNADAESFFLFDRKNGAQHFSEQDADLVAYALRGLKWFHWQIMITHGLFLANDPLTPRQRRVLLALLTGRPEKLIASDLGLTVATTHTYITDIFRKFAVRSRAELMALWLNKVGGE